MDSSTSKKTVLLSSQSFLKLWQVVKRSVAAEGRARACGRRCQMEAILVGAGLGLEYDFDFSIVGFFPV
jgi:hypothetical protein